jgi:hypothetical protein
MIESVFFKEKKKKNKINKVGSKKWCTGKKPDAEPPLISLQLHQFAAASRPFLSFRIIFTIVTI